MGKNLSKILFILAVCSIPIGFLIDHDHASFWWHRIPSLDVVVGGVGTFLLLGAKKCVSFFASRKEDLHD